MTKSEKDDFYKEIFNHVEDYKQELLLEVEREEQDEQ